MMCGAYASLIVSNSLFPEATADHAALIDSLGLNSSFLTMNKDVADCDIDDTACLQDVATLHGFYPEIMASIVAKQMLHFLANDGWNADGSVGADGEECTANCMPYGDTTGYAPRRRRHRRWKPLSEDNGKGFSYDYAHITPHIGRTAVTKTITRAELESRDASHPHYDYDAEIALVIERLADLATNDTAKMLVEFFDNKALVFVAILNAAEPLVGWSWEERQLFLVGYYAGEYDAVVQAWLEKVRWDRVRPTTLIKANGDERIITFGGPFRGVQTIKSRDFEAYKRVMPHSEYPSGSACICHTAAQFTRKFLTERHGITEALEVEIPNPHYRGGFAAGSSKLEPGLTLAEDLFITMESLACGEECTSPRRCLPAVRSAMGCEGTSTRPSCSTDSRCKNRIFFFIRCAPCVSRFAYKKMNRFAFSPAHQTNIYVDYPTHPFPFSLFCLRRALCFVCSTAK